MICISTRGGDRIDFVRAAVGGLAEDGGLFAPEAWPHFTQNEIKRFGDLPYAEVAGVMLDRFAGESLPTGVAAGLAAEAYAAFDDPDVAPMRALGRDTHLLELFHGPSLSFKDIAMQPLARLYDYVLAREGRRATIVCATSGDTGGAAVEAFRGRAHVDLVVLFPKGRVSEVQRRFMTTAAEKNVRPVEVDGDFDACQAMLKTLLADKSFARKLRLGAVNSINLTRIVAQTVYYFIASARRSTPDRPASFSVPTGNFGDAYAGCAARMMGLPMGRLVVGVNRNDIVARALAQGRYRRERAEATQSPAMDIQVASNFERFWFDCSARNAVETNQAFECFAATGSADIPPATLSAMRAAIDPAAISEETTTAVMRSMFEAHGVLLDPHSAVALAAAERQRSAGDGPMIVLGTAHPAKFPAAVRVATGRSAPEPDRVRRLFDLPERFDRLPADAEAAKAFITEAFA